MYTRVKTNNWLFLSSLKKRIFQYFFALPTKNCNPAHPLGLPFCLRILKLSLHPFPFLRSLKLVWTMHFTDETDETWGEQSTLETHKKETCIFLQHSNKTRQIKIFTPVLLCSQPRLFRVNSFVAAPLYQHQPWNWFGLSSNTNTKIHTL